jgi:2-methylcitrate dehydratase PrpD
MKEYTKLISNWVLSNKYENIPGNVIMQMKILTLDGIACAIHGSKIPLVNKVITAFSEKNPYTGSTVWCTDKKARADLATFINGTAVQSDELDSAGQHTHTQASNLTSALAAAEVLGNVSGKTFLNALIIGEEVLARIGNAFTVKGFLYQDIGLHQAGTLSPLGTVATLAQMHGLTEEQTFNALGISADRSYSLEITRISSEYKRSMQAHGGMIGVQSIWLANENFKGIENVLETGGGFFQFFTQSKDNFDLEKLLLGLGEEWLTLDAEMKKFMGMLYQHQHYYCAKLLREKNIFVIQNIDHIEILVDAIEYEHSNHIYNRIDSKTFAQFCIPYGVAVMLIEGDTFIDQYTDDKLKNPEIISLANKIHLSVNPDWPKDMNSGKRPSNITIYFKDGTSISEYAEYGYETCPMTKSDVIKKFMSLSTGVFPDETLLKIIDFVFNLEKMNDVAELAKLLQK